MYLITLSSFSHPFLLVHATGNVTALRKITGQTGILELSLQTLFGFLMLASERITTAKNYLISYCACAKPVQNLFFFLAKQFKPALN